MNQEIKANKFIENFRYNISSIRATFSILIKHTILGVEREKWTNYILQKYCIYNKESIKKLKYKKSIILFVNAGEILGINIFCKTLKELFQEHNLIIAVDNHDAYEIGKKLGISDLVIYTPWDFCFLGTKLKGIFNPQLIIFVVKVFHPVIINKFKQKNIYTALVSGHFRHEMTTIAGDIPHVKRLFANKAYESLDFISMQAEKYKNDLLNYINRSDILLLGDLRHDVSHAAASEEEKNKFYAQIKLTNKDTIIIAAATRADEDLILNAYKAIISKIPEVKLVLIPRHLENTSEIISLIENKGLKFTRLSQLKQKPEQIVIGDIIVELGKLYSIAKVIIFARTFLDPKSGNANILEPAYHGKPIIFGQYLNLFRPFVKQIIKKYPQIEVKNSEQLAESVIYFLKNKNIAKEVGEEFKDATKEGEKIAIDNARFIHNLIKIDRKKNR